MERVVVSDVMISSSEVFKGVSAHTCMHIYIYTVFLKKVIRSLIHKKNLRSLRNKYNHVVLPATHLSIA
jgi:hypothetical protein